MRLRSPGPRGRPIVSVVRWPPSEDHPEQEDHGDAGKAGGAGEGVGFGGRKGCAQQFAVDPMRPEGSSIVCAWTSVRARTRSRSFNW